MSEVTGKPVDNFREAVTSGVSERLAGVSERLGGVSERRGGVSETLVVVSQRHPNKRI